MMEEKGTVSKVETKTHRGKVTEAFEPLNPEEWVQVSFYQKVLCWCQQTFDSELEMHFFWNLSDLIHYLLHCC
jgi:hypothetical protein